MKRIIKNYITLTLAIILALSCVTPISAYSPSEDTPSFMVVFTTDSTEDEYGNWDIQADSTPFVQIIPQNGEATAPILTREGFVFDGWDTDFDNITEDTVVTAQWLRIGAVATGGTGVVSSADATWLARHIAGHYGFTLEDDRIGNLGGFDRPPNLSDVSRMMSWLVGYEFEDLRAEMTDDMPYIRLLTEIPHGPTHLGAIDIEYIAIPSPGAYIREVWVHTDFENGFRDSRAIYLSGTSPRSSAAARGTLGEGRIPLPTEAREGHITLHVLDSAGLTADYVFENIPYFVRMESIHPPDILDEHLAPSVYEIGLDYVINRLNIFTLCRNHITDNEIFAEAFSSIQGEIIGFSPGSVSWFTIQVPPSDEDGLEAMGEYLINRYPHLFREFWLEYDDDGLIVLDGTREGGGFLDSGMTSGSSFRTTETWWGTGSDWAFHTIDLPRAWSVFGAQVRQNVNVGIIDAGVDHTHPSLRIPQSNMLRRANVSNERMHGTSVMSVIGAAHNIGGEIAGAINICAGSLFNYDASHLDDEGNVIFDRRHVLDALEELVVNQRVRVINVSLGASSNIDPFTRRGNPSHPYFNERMNELLQRGYDFIIVHSAGNEPQNALYNDVFALVTEPHLRERIITVGNSTQQGTIAENSGYGSRVDVFAPGTNITTLAAGGGTRNPISGTSFASPHVAAIAAQILSMRPGLTGPEVKNIIVRTATSGRRIPEHRGEAISSEYRNSVYREVNAFAAFFYTTSRRMFYTTRFQDFLVGHVICDVTEESIPHASARIVPVSVMSTAHTTDYGFFRMLDGVMFLGPHSIFESHLTINAPGFMPYVCNDTQITPGVNEMTYRLTPRPLYVNFYIACDITNSPIPDILIEIVDTHRNGHWSDITMQCGRATVIIPQILGSYLIRISDPLGRYEPYIGHLFLNSTDPQYINRSLTPAPERHIFSFTGDMQSVHLSPGRYLLEVWGAEGGTDDTSPGGWGGYSRGEITLTNAQMLHIGVGGKGDDTVSVGVMARGGFNGGGNGGTNGGIRRGAAGGGATHIATSPGLLSSLNNNRSAVLIVAGGGGGGDQSDGIQRAGSGGGLIGESGGLAGGTQTGGFAFGQGGHGDFTRAGGGSGWFGGDAGNTLIDYNHRGSGGSGYIGGVTNGITRIGDGSDVGCPEGHGFARITVLHN